MAPVIVLNGPSSSGKSSIARELQAALGETFLTFGVDSLIAALPPAGAAGIVFAPDGGITVGDDFRRLEHAWYAGLAAMARDGAGLIIDEVFLGGGRSQHRLRAALAGLAVLWVGVRCDVDVAVAREAARPERVPGMAKAQAVAVHDGVDYDLLVDTTRTSAARCAATIAAKVARQPTERDEGR